METRIPRVQDLEEAVAQASRTGRRSRRLYETVVEFLTRYGESAILANWVKAVLTETATALPPHQGAPVVSIIVPCHNCSGVLAECIDSVLAQTFTAWELLIINQGSTDDTALVAATILAAHPEHHIRYVEQESRAGLTSPNRGGTLAKGEYLLPLDAEDLLAPVFLERTVGVLRSRPDLGYVSTKTLLLGTANNIWPHEPFMPLALFVTNQLPDTTLYRKGMWRDIGGYDERLGLAAMNWEFWIRCTKLGWTGEQLDEPLFFHRHPVDVRTKRPDMELKEQIVHLHPDVYDLVQLPTVREAMAAPNWIPPALLREPLPIRQRPGAPAVPRTDENTGVLRTLKRHLLEALGRALPDLQMIFCASDAGNGNPSLFSTQADRLGTRAGALLLRGQSQVAQELLATLLAAYPLEKRAVLELLHIVAESGDLDAAYATGKLYASIFADAADLLAVLADILRRQAASLDAPGALGLLDGAALFAPDNAAIQADLAAAKARLWPTEIHDNCSSAAPRVWYVTDAFGPPKGGSSDANQAKFMTLSSLLRGKDGPCVCVITPLRPNLPEALAAFARYLIQVSGPEGCRWPEWIATTDQACLARPETDATALLASGACQHPLRPLGKTPECLVVEGLRLEAHDYLLALAPDAAIPKILVLHTSPAQFRDRYTDEDLLPQAEQALAAYDGCVCVSASSLAQWRALDGLAGKTWIHIPNCAREEAAAPLLARDPLELREALGLPREAFIGLCLASVQGRKGQDVLLTQLPWVLERLPRALFLFVGTVAHDWGGREILDYANRHFSQANVRFLGLRRNALDYIRAADCLVLPSREESLPLSILEAMFLGKPTVASDVNGIPELVVPGETGLLFSHDTPSELGRHLIRLGSEPNTAREMGQRARKRYLELFSRQCHAARWREAIAGLAATAGAKAAR